jgi:small subunit ribosomal protein S17
MAETSINADDTTAETRPQGARGHRDLERHGQDRHRQLHPAGPASGLRQGVPTHQALYVHDEENTLNVGDRVRVVETRPLSKNKRWRLLEILERAR